MSKMNIAVLFGSRSCEHDVSIISAMQLMEAAKTAGEPMADLALGQGGRPTGEVVTVHWDNLYELEKYYISAYTFIYDVRPVPVANTFLSLVEQGQMANNHT